MIEFLEVVCNYKILNLHHGNYLPNGKLWQQQILRDDYSVTPMDGAMLTRMLHTTLKFNAKIWAEWAYAAKVDERGISFVLTYPELVNSERTTPRSLTQFFEQIAPIDDLKGNLELVEALALSSLDEVTVSSFIAFVNDELTQLIDPEEILDAKDFKDIEKKITDISVDDSGAKRVDRLSTMCSRLYIKLTSDDYKKSENHSKNLINFLMFETIPNDLLMSLYMDLQKHGNDEIKEMTRDKKLASKLLSTL